MQIFLSSFMTSWTPTRLTSFFCYILSPVRIFRRCRMSQDGSQIWIYFGSQWVSCELYEEFESHRCPVGCFYDMFCYHKCCCIYPASVDRGHAWEQRCRIFWFMAIMSPEHLGWPGVGLSRQIGWLRFDAVTSISRGYHIHRIVIRRHCSLHPVHVSLFHLPFIDCLSYLRLAASIVKWVKKKKYSSPSSIFF